MNMEFVTLHVVDLESSLKFYTEVLGFKEFRRINPPGPVKIIFLTDADGMKLELLSGDNKGVTGGGIVSLGFAVENMDETVKSLKEKNIEIIRGPIDIPGGEKLLFVKDPDGVEIEFIEGFRR